MWDHVYATKEYKYGTAPNVFFAENIKEISPGKILFPAEGEGRNAVYAALQGWKVSAFDRSYIAKKKALQLAEKRGVEIEYLHGGFEEMTFQKESFDCIVLIYAHFPEKRELYHGIISYWLKPGGKLILEGFSKGQKNNNSGGPKDPDLLFSKKELQNDFNSLSKIEIEEKTIELSEGRLHQGSAEVVRMIGVK